ncbi:recombination mediator RecR [Spiroplasma eriocheiris]|uniref:Recombination protein RecR n=1 Tax=Spiroplasma eriocheiris TaxID=315358 RepID=A0A0H3XIQ0_9MOLU|nr:recombination mediator RecR [Spiroplasma eriocheiris]AHF57148.1 putative DNA replication and repair protein RecR [Spiroplasma eriocheiris CCTCC M 207170]AKM53616.1 recombination protein RecR [Spiroplasma eriocheiris]
MNNYDEIIEELKTILGVGKKVAERIFNKLVTNPNVNTNLSELLSQIKEQFSQCPICFSLMKDNQCLFCYNDLRDNTKLCIVTNVFDVFTFEKARIFNGLYHVLNQEINVKNGITPDKITVKELESRLNDKIINEVIIAVSSTFEGEVTAQYLKNIIEKYHIKVSRLARGIPIGGTLDYIDEATLKQALEGRKDI